MVTDIGSPLVDAYEWSYQRLAQAYETSTPVFRSNLVVSRDGAIADRRGSSRGLSSSMDVRVLRTLRALSDVIIVGGATARAEGYQPGRLHPDAAAITDSPPRLAVISRLLDLDCDGPLFTGATRPIILTTKQAVARANTADARRLAASADIVATDGEITGRWVRRSLEDMGMPSAVVEGGPTVQELMRQAHALDEIDLTVSPLIVGAPLGSPHSIDAALGPIYERLDVTSVFAAEGSVFLRLTCLHSVHD